MIKIILFDIKDDNSWIDFCHNISDIFMLNLKRYVAEFGIMYSANVSVDMEKYIHKFIHDMNLEHIKYDHIHSIIQAFAQIKQEEDLSSNDNMLIITTDHEDALYASRYGVPSFNIVHYNNLDSVSNTILDIVSNNFGYKKPIYPIAIKEENVLDQAQHKIMESKVVLSGNHAFKPYVSHHEIYEPSESSDSDAL